MSDVRTRSVRLISLLLGATVAGTGLVGVLPAHAAPAAVSIAEIQGTGAASPLAGQQVSTTGVVTANYPTGGFNGFYLQTPGSGRHTKAPGDASDGVFVFGSTAVEVGSCYRVTATVAEYGTLTELTRPTVEPAGDCAPVKAVRLTTLPGTDAEREPYEGMLVRPAGQYTITNNYGLNTYGQVGITPGTKPLYTPTDRVVPERAAAFEAKQVRRYITLDDGSSWDYGRNATAQDSPLPYLSQHSPMRTASQLRFAEPVVLDYRFQWNFQPTAQVVGADQHVVRTENDRPAQPPRVGGQLQLATFNVLNYFTDLGADEPGCKAYRDRDNNPVTTNGCQVRGAYTAAALSDQQAKIVNAINGTGADVAALMEVENSAGLSYVTHDRDRALAQLVDALNARLSPRQVRDDGRWDFVPSPVARPGSEDVIRTAFIYRTRNVRPVGASEILLDSAFANARYPLAQEFQALGTPKPGRFLAVANHFKSKGSGADDGTGQGLSNPSREEQARALTSWVTDRWADRPTFLLGDFNAYSRETPVQIVERAGFTEVVQRYSRRDPLTYQFDGRLGSLDHIFANAAATRLVTGAGVWDINADESVAMQYSRRNANVTDFYRPTPYAASDHDPALVGVRFR